MFTTFLSIRRDGWICCQNPVFLLWRLDDDNNTDVSKIYFDVST